MKAVILAGGKGTRLAPYTFIFPKPLVPLGHQPIIDIIIRQLSSHGFTDIILSVGYLAELIQAYLTNGNGRYKDINFTYVKEAYPLGTAGSLGLLKNVDETLLVMNGDILTTMNYADIIAFHEENQCTLTIGMHRKRVKIDLGVLTTDSVGNITDYIEKPEKHHLVSMGIYVYSPQALRYIKPDEYLDFPDLVIRLIENNEKVMGFESDAYWLDIGRHDDYAEAQKKFEEMKDSFLPQA
jgi:NDP-sugar pyrophosphorylase family protein